MPRLSLAARITLIVLIALMATWIAAVARFYLASDLDGEVARPSPRRVAAFIELLERSPRDDWPLILDAIASNVLEARLEHGAVQAPLAAEVRPVAAALRDAYAASLGNRPLAIASPPPSDLQRRFPRLSAAMVEALEFRIGLRTGETLILDTRRPIFVNRLGLPVGFGAGLLGTCIALVALLIMHRETRPLVRLAAAVDRMDPGGAAVALPPPRRGAPEIRALIAAFNRLQARLSQLLRARMAMLGGISHDVRTFATRLRLRVDQIPDAGERDRAVADIADMIRLLDDALLASRAGAGELAEELVEFERIVRAEVEDRRAAGAAIDLRSDPGAAEVNVLGDRLALRRIVANLADNALQYGRVARLAVTADAAWITLIVDDEGAGIRPEQREILLEPFVRLEASRNRRTGGAGLGLAVVRTLTDAHGGTIAIGDAPAGGARFTLRLPIFRAAWNGPFVGDSV